MSGVVKIVPRSTHTTTQVGGSDIRVLKLTFTHVVPCILVVCGGSKARGSLLEIDNIGYIL